MSASATTAAIALIARLCLGPILLSSAAGKWRHKHAWTHGVLDYQVVPERWALIGAFVIPWSELLLALALITGFMLKVAGALTVGFLLAVSTAVMINLRRKRAIPCNCHGIVGSNTISWGIIGRNGLLVALAAMVSVGASNNVILQWNAERSLFAAPASFVLVLMMMACCWVLLQLTEWTILIGERVAKLRKRVYV